MFMIKWSIVWVTVLSLLLRQLTVLAECQDCGFFANAVAAFVNRNQKSEIRNQKSEIRNQKSEIRNQK